MASNQLPKGGVEAANQVRPNNRRVTKNRQASFTDSLLELDSQISQKKSTPTVISSNNLGSVAITYEDLAEKGVLFCGERLFLDLLSKNVVIGIDPW